MQYKFFLLFLLGMHTFLNGMDDPTHYNKSLMAKACTDGNALLDAHLIACGLNPHEQCLQHSPYHLQELTLNPVRSTYIHLAARNWHWDIIDLLLKAGVSVDVNDTLLGTPLMYAIAFVKSADDERKSLATVQFLLKCGALNNTLNCLGIVRRAGVSLYEEGNSEKDTAVHLAACHPQKLCTLLMPLPLNLTKKFKLPQSELSELRSQNVHREINLAIAIQSQMRERIFTFLYCVKRAAITFYFCYLLIMIIACLLIV